MARIPLVTDGDPNLPDDVRAFVAERSAQSGRTSNIFRVMANHLPLAQAFSDFAAAFYRNGDLPPKERELVYTTATTVNNCHY